MLLTLLICLATLSLCSLCVLSASAEEWRSRSIYQVLTDRFATSDLSSPSCDTSARKYCGGTWTGLAEKLDYIQTLGFDAVWISPIVKNIDNETEYGTAYHGYWTQDITRLNPHFGNENSLIGLSQALHDRGMYLLLDVVVNHVATNVLPTPFEQFTPFNQSSAFHPFCYITDYNNQTQVENCSLGDRDVTLADLNTENQSVIDTFNSWIHDTVMKYGVDGLRLDTAKHVRKEFWSGFRQNASVWVIGEVLSDKVSYVGPYSKYIDSVLDYPGYFALTEAFSKPQADLSSLVEVIQETQSYASPPYTGSFLENHDQPRFRSRCSDSYLQMNALAYTFVNDGIPIVYYGIEQGYEGGHDPHNREAMWFSNYTRSKTELSSTSSANSTSHAK